MSKILFVPFSVLGGIIAGAVGKKAFEGLWGVVDDQEPPDAKHRQVQLRKLIPALLLEGAIFRALKGLFDHGSRRLFSKLTGRWPGEERPDPA
ncbi:MAG: hypothetical protein QOK19_1920 [Solirubrobacteraceae bacterium]|jgi:hypothetical protein|nr:hypothetical protein [Solirubrobacterales bacterium]MEA2216359.1 hypothetical protein [Solirubrobacteraceae bacterium]